MTDSNTILFCCTSFQTNSHCSIARTCCVRTNCNCIMRYFAICASVSISTGTDINILFAFCGFICCWMIRCNRNRTRIYIHCSLSSTHYTKNSTRKCGQFNDFFRFGFTFSMPKFRNCSPRLCSMIPNNFKHFVHINLFLLLGWLRSCYSCNSAEKFNVRKAATTDFGNSFPFLSGQNSLF